MDIIQRHHDAPAAGHSGRTRTAELIQRSYSWPGLLRTVAAFVKACDTCQRIKSRRHKPYGLLKPLPVPSGPWRNISMDFVVKLPLSKGFDSIFVVVDKFTKMTHYVRARESMTAKQLAEPYLSRIFRHHGLSDSIVSDRGATFVSRFWDRVCQRLKIKSLTARM